MSRKDHLKKLIANYNRRLRILQEQQALHGLDIPPKLLIEIEDIEAKIADLQVELEESEPSPESVSKQENLSTAWSVSSSSPFVCGGAVPPDLFYGREDTLRVIARRITARSLQSISIVGERRIGKSSLLNYIVTSPEQFLSQSEQYIFLYLDLMKGSCHTRSNLFKTMRRELQRLLGSEPWPPSEDGNLGAFDFALEDIQAQGKSVVLCLDQMENLTRRSHEFDEILEDWRANGQMGQMAMITSSTRPLADLCTSGGLISPFYNIFIQETLGLLAESEWRELILDHFDATNDDLSFIEMVAGGHPFFTQMAADSLWNAYQNEKLNYDELYQDLLKQLEPHMASIWRSLTPVEQSILHEATMGHLRPKSNRGILKSLHERGLLRNNSPFSLTFADGIRSGRWN